MPRRIADAKNRPNTLATLLIGMVLALTGCVAPDRVSKDPADAPTWGAALPSSATPSPTASSTTADLPATVTQVLPGR